MELEVQKLRKEDHEKAMDFAAEGMHFEYYKDNQYELKTYRKFFCI